LIDPYRKYMAIFALGMAKIDTVSRTPDNGVMEDWLTEETLLAGAAEAGAAVSHHRLKRWRIHGLIPRPKQLHVKGCRGSVSVYPPETLRQVIEVYRLHQKERRLDELRLRVWRGGFDVPTDKIRSFIREVLDRLKREAQRWGAQHPDTFDAAETLAMSLASTSRAPFLRSIRRRLRRNDADVFTVLLIVCQITLGDTPEWEAIDVGTENVEPAPQDILFRALGLEKAATQGIGKAGPLIPEGSKSLPLVFATMQEAGVANFTRLLHVIDTATDAELVQARDLGKLLTEDLVVWIEALQIIYGQGAFGLEFLRYFQSASAEMQAMLVPVCIALTRKLGPAVINSFGQTLHDSIPKAKALVTAASAFPQYTRYFTPDGIAEAAGLSEEVRKHIAEEVQDYTKAHPEFVRTLDALGARPENTQA
jgi:hypothetical protein